MEKNFFFIIILWCLFNVYIFRVTGVEKHTKERRNSISSNVSEKTDSLSSEGGNSSRSDLEHLVDR